MRYAMLAWFLNLSGIALRTLDANTMPDTVRERVTVPCFCNNVSGGDVDASGGGILSHLMHRLGLRFKYYVPDLGYVRRLCIDNAMEACLELLLDIPWNCSFRRLLKERGEECSTDIRGVAIQMCTVHVSFSPYRMR